MYKRTTIPITMILLGALLLAAALLLFSPAPQQASAQCGSQASSCKTCHETQGKDPVNADGTGWHQNHAFGDFCYICHAGNNQSMEQDQAHTGMVPPLSDPKAACESCHADDLDARVKVYADKLGVTPGTGAGPTAPQAPASSSGSEAPPSSGSGAAPTGGEIVAPSGSEVVDYSQLYDQQASGMPAINWGNALLLALIFFTAVGGGIFIYWNEKRLGTIGRKPAEKPAPVSVEELVVEGYSTDVTGLLPLIAKLNPTGQLALKRLLKTQNPDVASEMLHSLSNLDPELVRRLRSLDRESRSLLMALAGD